MTTSRISVLRSVKGVSQKEFADAIGVIHTTVSSWERGKSYPSQAQLQKISEEYDVSLAWLLDEAPVKIPRPGRSNTLR